MKDWAREAEVGGLDDLSHSKLKDWVDGEDDLKKGKGLSNWMVFKDMLASYGKEGRELQGVGKKVGSVEGGVSKGSGYEGVLNGSEVPKPPEVKSRVW